MNRWLASVLVIIISFFILGSVFINISTKPSAQKMNPIDFSSPASAAINKQQGRLFMATNKLKPGILTLPSGLEYRVVRPGAGMRPTLTDVVFVHYVGKYINGTVFDNKYKKGTPPVALRVSSVIPGWQQALPMMSTSSVWELYVPPELAYGEQGIPGIIGPNQTLIFTIQLVSVQHPR